MTVLSRNSIPIFDQLLSTLGNFLISLIAARLLSVSGFGIFSLAYALYVLFVGTVRGTVGHIVLSASHDLDSGPEHPWRAVCGAGVLAGIVGGIGLVIASIFLGGETGRTILVLALLLPLLILQDLLRHCFISAQRAYLALTNDAVWLVAIIPSVIVVRTFLPLSPVSLLLGWGLSGAIAGIIACFQGRTLPGLISGARWLKRVRHVVFPYFGEYLSASGGQQAAILALAPVAGIAAVAANRGTLVFFGPITVFCTAMYMILIPHATRLRDQPEALSRSVTLSACAISAGCIIWTGIGLVLPTGLGQAFLGHTWTAAKPLILPTGIGFAVSSAAIAALSGLRALRAVRYSLAARMWSLPLMLLLSLSFAAKWGALGYAIGNGLESVATGILIMLAFRRANATRGDRRNGLDQRKRAQHSARRRSPLR